MRKLVVINQDAGYLMIDTVNQLAGEGFVISLITGRLVVRNNPLADGVITHKIAKYNKSSRITRLLSWIIAFVQIVFIIKLRYRKAYLLIVTNPPLTTFLPLFCRNKYSYLIYDIYPEILTTGGMIDESSLIVRLWRKSNKITFSRSDNIFTLSEGMALMLDRYLEGRHIDIIPVWSDNEFFRPIPKEINPFSAKHNLYGKFVVLYSGNLGATHNIDLLPEVASKVKNKKIKFIIIGNGDRRKWLEGRLTELNLGNVLVLDPLPSTELPYSFSSADLAIVTLSQAASGMSVPSKTYNYMSAGLPLLGIAGEDSELNRLITKYGNGKCFGQERKEEIISFIDHISNNIDLANAMKAKSLSASQDFSLSNCRRMVDILIKSIGSNRVEDVCKIS